jgi:hypothetical protein
MENIYINQSGELTYNEYSEVVGVYEISEDHFRFIKRSSN